MKLIQSIKRVVPSRFKPLGYLQRLVERRTRDRVRSGPFEGQMIAFGGTLHNKVVFHIMKALNSFGFPVLRFNFRGAGLSHGQHDNGEGEADDARAAFEWLNHEFGLPMIFAGFSFGAAVGLRAACPDPRVKAAMGVGTPVSPVDMRSYDLAFLRRCVKPKLFVSGEHDVYGPRIELEKLVESLPDPKQLVIVAGADHFFDGHLPQLRESIEVWLRQLLAGSIA